MKTAEERTDDFINAFISNGCFQTKDVPGIRFFLIQLFKEQDQMTRHTCAETVLKLSTYHPGPFCKTYVDVDEAHNAIMNTKAI